MSRSKSSVISFPPTPAITTASTSPGFNTVSPSPARNSARAAHSSYSPVKYRLQFSSAFAREGTLISARITRSHCPLCNRNTGKKPWSVPISAMVFSSFNRSAMICSLSFSLIISISLLTPDSPLISCFWSDDAASGAPSLRSDEYVLL